jgi:hypothetical protein
MSRERVHQRRIDMQGYRRGDGLFDIEAKLIDSKDHAMHTATGRVFAAGDEIHHMLLRLVVDVNLQIVAVQARTVAAPYGVCAQGPSALQSLVGLRIGPGWSRAVRERLSGAQGCTHLRELLGPLATVAFQTLWQVREAQVPLGTAAHLAAKADSCWAYASSHAQAAHTQPQHFSPWADQQTL